MLTGVVSRKPVKKAAALAAVVVEFGAVNAADDVEAVRGSVDALFAADCVCE